MTRALILGLGRFGGGREAALFLLRRGYQVRISDHGAADTLQDGISALAGWPDVEWRLEPPAPDHLDDVDLLVVNPAVPESNPLLAAARAKEIEVTQEANLFLEHFPGKTLLVTGTNGKSTTTSLLHKALLGSGFDALIGGNIGRSLLSDEASWRKDQVAVMEISSFQLERVDLDRHRAVGAVIVRVTTDHIDRHGSVTAYHRAKSRVARIVEKFLVHGAEDPVAASFVTTAPLRATFTAREPGPGQVGFVDGWLVSRLGDEPERVLHVDALELLGRFQHENVQAAFTAARLLGASTHRAALALVRERPLQFRLQKVKTSRGVHWFDNAVSTEVLSTLSAVETLPKPLRWVGGGKSKDGDFRRVADLLAPHLASAHLFGAAAEPMAALLAKRMTVTRHATVEEALAAASAAAQAGESVLFSPAFASFDQYPNFRARAEVFHRFVARLPDDLPRNRSRPAESQSTET